MVQVGHEKEAGLAAGKLSEMKIFLSSKQLG